MTENILISLLFVWLGLGSEKVEEWIKMSLYKFTHIPLLKNDAQLKQKSDKQPKKKKSHKFIFKKIILKKKSFPVKKKKTQSTTSKKSKEKIYI